VNFVSNFCVLCVIDFSGYGIILLNKLLKFVIFQKIRHAVRLSEYNTKNDTFWKKCVINFGLFCNLSKNLSSGLSLYFLKFGRFTCFLGIGQ
jgi:hypothetical protein